MFNIQNKLSKNKHFLKQLGSSYSFLIVSIVLMIIQTPIMLEKLGTENYGIWILIQNIINYLNLFNFGFISTLIAEYTKNNNREKLFSTVFYTLLFLACISITVFAAINYWFGDIFKISDSNVILAKATFLYMFIVFIINFISAYFDSILYYLSGEVIKKNIIDIIKIILLNVGYIVIVLNDGSISEMALFSIPVTIVCSLIMYVLARKHHQFSLRFENFDYTLLKSLIVPSWHFLLLVISNVIIFNGDNILISLLLGVKFVVLYSLSFRLSDISIRFIKKITDTKAPEIIKLISNKNFLKAKKLFGKLVIITLAVSFIAFISISLLGKYILQIWLHHKEPFDGKIIITFAIFIIANSFYYICWVFLNIIGRHKGLAYISFAEIVLNVLLSVILSKYYGLLGIALATLITSVGISTWYAYYQVQKYFKSQITEQLAFQSHS